MRQNIVAVALAAIVSSAVSFSIAGANSTPTAYSSATDQAVVNQLRTVNTSLKYLLKSVGQYHEDGSATFYLRKLCEQGDKAQGGIGIC